MVLPGPPPAGPREVARPGASVATGGRGVATGSDARGRAGR
jgi:hypothetical protein